jgi:hypothetical protein
MPLGSQTTTVTVQMMVIHVKKFRLPKLSMDNPICEFPAVIIDVAVQLVSRNKSILDVQLASRSKHDLETELVLIASVAHANLMGTLRSYMSHATSSWSLFSRSRGMGFTLAYDMSRKT